MNIKINHINYEITDGVINMPLNELVHLDETIYNPEFEMTEDNIEEAPPVGGIQVVDDIIDYSLLITPATYIFNFEFSKINDIHININLLQREIKLTNLINRIDEEDLYTIVAYHQDTLYEIELQRKAYVKDIHAELKEIIDILNRIIMKCTEVTL